MGDVKFFGVKNFCDFFLSFFVCINFGSFFFFYFLFCRFLSVLTTKNLEVGL